MGQKGRQAFECHIQQYSSDRFNLACLALTAHVDICVLYTESIMSVMLLLASHALK